MDQKSSIVEKALISSDVCSQLNSREIEAITASMKLFKYRKGEYACKESEIGFHYFVIASGEFDMLKHNSEEILSKLEIGYSFGEGVFVQQGLDYYKLKFIRILVLVSQV